MKKRFKILINGALLSGIVFGSALQASAYGVIDPMSFQTSGSLTISNGRAGIVQSAAGVGGEISLPSRTNLARLENNIGLLTNYSGTNLSAWATTRNYGYKSPVSLSRQSPARRSTGYVLDKVSFGANNFGSDSIESIYNNYNSPQLYSNNRSAAVVLTSRTAHRNYPSYISPIAENYYFPRGNMAGGLTAGDIIVSPGSLSLPGFFNYTNPNLLPYIIDILGNVAGGTLSWSNTYMSNVVVMGGDSSVIFSSSSYITQSGSFTFNPTVAAPSEVPLPGAVWLLGMGLAGIAGLRGRGACRSIAV